MHGQDSIVKRKMEKLDKSSVNSKKSNLYIIPASIMKRFFAFVIDLLILNIFVISPFNSIFDSMLGVSDYGGASSSAYEIILANSALRSSLTSVLVSISILIVFYFLVLQIKFGQSIGMMVLNIYVVKIPALVTQQKSRRAKQQITQSNMKLGLFDVLLRNVFVIPFAPFIFFWFIDPIFLFFNKNSQRLLEVFSRTMTVEIIDYNTTIKNQRRWL